MHRCKLRTGQVLGICCTVRTMCWSTRTCPRLPAPPDREAMREGPRLLGLGAACAIGLAGMFQPPEAGAIDVDSLAKGGCRGGGCTAIPPRPCNGSHAHVCSVFWVGLGWESGICSARPTPFDVLKATGTRFQKQVASRQQEFSTATCGPGVKGWSLCKAPFCWGAGADGTESGASDMCGADTKLCACAATAAP